ncbi:hypothetical protein GCM10010193_37500 [Kitasatospora atroaurantiaca]
MLANIPLTDLEALAGPEARHRGLPHPHTFAGLRVARVTGRALHLLQRAEPRDRHPLPGHDRAHHHIEHRIHGVLRGAAAAELPGDRFDELSLVHDDDSLTNLSPVCGNLSSP